MAAEYRVTWCLAACGGPVENAGGVWDCVAGCRGCSGWDGGGVYLSIGGGEISNVSMSLSNVTATGNTAGEIARHVCALLLSS